MAEYSQMADEQLEKENQKLGKARLEIKHRQKKISDELDRRAAQKRLGGMSDKERENMRQVLGPGSIPSEEAVGKPGG